MFERVRQQPDAPSSSFPETVKAQFAALRERTGIFSERTGDSGWRDKNWQTYTDQDIKARVQENLRVVMKDEEFIIYDGFGKRITRDDYRVLTVHKITGGRLQDTVLLTPDYIETRTQEISHKLRTIAEPKNKDSVFAKFKRNQLGWVVLGSDEERREFGKLLGAARLKALEKKKQAEAQKFAVQDQTIKTEIPQPALLPDQPRREITIEDVLLPDQETIGEPEFPDADNNIYMAQGLEPSLDQVPKPIPETPIAKPEVAGKSKNERKIGWGTLAASAPIIGIAIYAAYQYWTNPAAQVVSAPQDRPGVLAQRKEEHLPTIPIANVKEAFPAPQATLARGSVAVEKPTAVVFKSPTAEPTARPKPTTNSEPIHIEVTRQQATDIIASLYSDKIVLEPDLSFEDAIRSKVKGKLGKAETDRLITTIDNTYGLSIALQIDPSNIQNGDPERVRQVLSKKSGQFKNIKFPESGKEELIEAILTR